MRKICFAILFILPLLGFAQKMEITHGPYLQKMGEREVTIVWTTNKDALSWVELAPSGNDSFYADERLKFFDTGHGSKKIGRLHRVTLKNLQPGTGYRYRIFSKEVLSYEGHRVIYGNIASSDVYGKKPLTFTTLDVAKGKLSFRVVNDIHGKNDNLKAMVDNANPANTDFVIFNGDMISMVTADSVIFTGFMDTSIRLFAKETPFFYARGNHETRGKSSSNFYDYFPTSTGKFYYTFRDGPVFFIVLDSGEDKPDSDIEYSDLAHFDEYRAEQAKWLESVVNSPECKAAPYRIVVMHIPPFASGWHGMRDVAEKFLPILNNAKIDVMLSGHTHNYRFVDKGEDKRINFPLLINDDETWLDVGVDSQAIEINQKDLQGKTLNKHIFKYQK